MPFAFEAVRSLQPRPEVAAPGRDAIIRADTPYSLVITLPSVSGIGMARLVPLQMTPSM
jgi:hypothetical protein